MWDIASGLLAMHANKFAHRDLKPENILVKTVELPGRQRLVFKISDFGTAKAVERFTNSAGHTVGGGTFFYKSPECLLLDLGGSRNE
jgi:serine/threonine protein kinase